MLDNEVLLSIIVTVYNRECFLNRCLDSILMQFNDNVEGVEVIVVDDGSTDNSKEIIKQYEYKFSKNITTLFKNNGGVSDARNYGLNIANGKYVWFIDSDDYITKNCVHNILSMLDHSNVDYFYFNANIVNSDGDIIGRFEHGMKASSCQVFEFSYSDIKRNFSKHMVWLRIYKRSFIGQLRFPVGVTHEDIYFDLMLLGLKPHIHYIDDYYYYHYFDNPISITNTMNVEKFRHVLKIYSYIIEEFESNVKLNNNLTDCKLIALDGIFNRMLYLTTVKHQTVEERIIFNEYARNIINIYNTLGVYNTPQLFGVNKYVYVLICNNFIKIAYFIIKMTNFIKNIIERKK
ncbi:glycosyltransferase [Geobacter pickeringii]|uniref:glycosyltransferase n=1 Tax=Geobacter pickeringii TaxID=345632 RepID=UPI0009FFA10E|nr:glycosyltransferase [Geobacter pickeringii]